MKKFLLVVLLCLAFVLGFFSGSVPSLFRPQKAEAFVVTTPVSDALAIANWLIQFAEDAKAYALEAKKYEQMIADYVQFTKQTIELIQGNKTAAGLACYAEQTLGVNVRGILGQYGLGGLPATADKILSGAGVKDLLCDQIGGCIGAGGILSGGLSGLYSRPDLVSATIEQFGVRIPSGVAGRLADIGVIDTRNVARIFAGQQCPCVGSVCPANPIKPPATPQGACYNPNRPSIIQKTEKNISYANPGSSILGLTVVADPNAPPVPANCKNPVPPVSKDDLAKILWVLDREGKHVSAEEASNLIAAGLIDPQVTLQKYIPNPGETNSGNSGGINSSNTNNEDVTGRPPCAEWGSDGLCIKYKILF